MRDYSEFLRDSSYSELPPGLYLGLPLILFFLPYFLTAYFPELADFYFQKESGIVENITVVLLAIALVLTIKCLIGLQQGELKQKSYTILRAWFLLYLLGCVYYLGEEISWGQHFFGWATPEAWVSVNDQQETNLHNTLGVFDQLPRALVTLAIVLGGIFLPLLRRSGRFEFGEQDYRAWILPGFATLPTAIAVLAVSLHDKPYELLSIAVPAFMDFDDGESKEAIIALFIVLYIASIYRRGKGSLFSG